MWRRFAASHEQSDGAAPVLDQLNGVGVCEVPRALPVDLDQLIADAKPAVQRGRTCGAKKAVFSFRRKRKR